MCDYAGLIDCFFRGARKSGPTSRIVPPGRQWHVISAKTPISDGFLPFLQNAANSVLLCRNT